MNYESYYKNSIKMLEPQEGKWNIEKILIFVAVLFSSVTGMQFLGVSMNKLALLPFEIWLLTKASRVIKINSTQNLLILWYFFSILSCVIAYGNLIDLEDYYSSITNWIIQTIFIYLPVTLLISKCNNCRKNFIDCVLIVAKINVIWAITQFILWYGMQIDFNDLIFNDILHGVFGEEWTAWSFETRELGLRVTGLNHDSAFLSILMIFGVAFEKNWLWKTIFVVINFFSMSRSGIIVTSILYIFLLKKGAKKKIKKRTLLYAILGTVFVTGVMFYLIKNNAYVQFQLDYTFQRLLNIGTSVGGTDRHRLYPIAAIDVWLSVYNPIQKLFGIGVRVGGTAFALNDFITNQYFVLNQGMLSHAWAVECDFAELLLGNGILGFFIYYILFKVYKIINKTSLRFSGGIYIIPAIILFGLMYDVLTTTLIQFFIICMSSQNKLRENI